MCTCVCGWLIDCPNNIEFLSLLLLLLFNLILIQVFDECLEGLDGGSINKKMQIVI